MIKDKIKDSRYILYAKQFVHFISTNIMMFGTRNGRQGFPFMSKL